MLVINSLVGLTTSRTAMILLDYWGSHTHGKSILFIYYFFLQNIYINFYFFVRAHRIISFAHAKLTLTHPVLRISLHFKCIPLNDLYYCSHENDSNAFFC